MGKTIINMGGGNIVDSSKNVTINQYSNTASDSIQNQLTVLLGEYKIKYPDDAQGIEDITKAIDHASGGSDSQLDKFLCNLKINAIKLAKELSLGLVLNALSKAIGI